LIRCTKCGTINNDTDIFCGKCASFLEWTGVKVDQAEVSTPLATDVPGAADSAGGANTAPAADTPPVVPPPRQAPLPVVTPAQPQVPQPPPAPATAPPAAPPPPSFSSPFGDAPPPGAAAAQSAPPPPKVALEPPPPPSYKFKASAAPHEPASQQKSAQPATTASSASAPTPAQPPIPSEPPPVKPTAAQPPARPPQTVALGEPRSRQPTLEQPKPRPITPQRQSVATEPEIRPGDLICGVCGAGNSPERSFCRRCGNSLAAATVAVAVRLPWYRRIFAGRGQPQVMVAGERPAYMGRRGRSAGWYIKRLLVVALVVAIIAPVVAYFAVPSFKEQINALLGQGGATVLLSQHPSTAALDTDINTYWLADQASGHTTVTVNFGGKAEDLAALTFNTGAPGQDFAKYGRPREVQLIFLGDPNPVSILLDDTPAPQPKCLHTNHLTATFDIRIVSSYPPQGADKNLVAVREIGDFKSGSCPPQS
jgi:hypothetical protein